MAVEYANGSSLWASVSTPNKFGQYLIYLTTNEDEASRLESIGLSRVKDKSGAEKYLLLSLLKELQTEMVLLILHQS